MSPAPKNRILTQSHVLELLDTLLPNRVDWEPFYADGKRTPPFLQNLPDENLVSYYRDHRPCKVLEIGCGPGRNAVYMAKAGSKVTAIDLSRTAVRRAEERASEAGVDVSFEVGSIFDLDSNDGEYDFVYDSGVLHHMRPHRRPAYLEIIHRMMKVDGEFGLVCFDDTSAPIKEDWEIYEEMKMPPGIGYSEERLRSILEPLYDIREFRQMRQLDGESGMLGMKGFWTVLMQPKTLAL